MGEVTVVTRCNARDGEHVHQEAQNHVVPMGSPAMEQGGGQGDGQGGQRADDEGEQIARAQGEADRDGVGERSAQAAGRGGPGAHVVLPAGVGPVPHRRSGEYASMRAEELA